MLSTTNAQDHLQKNLKIAKDLLIVGLNLIKEKVGAGLIWHILIALSHLASQKEKFAEPFNESHFSDKLSDFHEFYAQTNPNGK